METHRMVDALTDHLAIYHRSSVVKTKSRARQTVVEWMSSLSCDQRRAALTVVDRSWVAVLLRMQKYLIEEGAGVFILLPDVPVSGGENTSIVAKSSRHHKGRQDDNGSLGKSTRSSKSAGAKGVEASPSASVGKRAGKHSTGCTLAPPGLCYRRAKGLVRRLEEKQASGILLVNSIRLFNSGDGEKTNRLPDNDTVCVFDCVTVTEDLVGNLAAFLEIMDDLSHDEFLKSPYLSPASPWEEMPWLKDMGYYSLPAFVANKFEFCLWAAWSHAQGTRKLPKSIALKLKDTQNGSVLRACSCDLHGNAAVASSVFGRKQGCMDWWSKLEIKERSKLVGCTLAAASKTEVLKIVAASRAGGEVNDAKARDQSKAGLRGHGKTRLRCSGRLSLSDSEVEQHVSQGPAHRRGAGVAPYLAGLQALKELSEFGLLCAKMEGTDAILENNTSWMFDSTLKSVHTWSDRVIREARNVLVKVRNDHVERELFGDDNSSIAHKGNGGGSRDLKVSKAKKKRRKQASTPRPGVSREEEKTSSPKPKPAQDEGKEHEQGHQFVFTNVLPRSPGVDHRMSASEPMVGGVQDFGCQGKGEKFAVQSEKTTHQHSALVTENFTMNDEILCVDATSCSLVSVEDSRGRLVDGNVGATSEDNSNETMPCCQVCVQSPVRSVEHYDDKENSSSRAISCVGQGKLCELQDTQRSLVNSSGSKMIVSSIDPLEIPLDDLVITVDRYTCAIKKDPSYCQNLFSPQKTRPYIQDQSNKISDCPVSLSIPSDSRKPIYSSKFDQTVCNAPACELPVAQKQISSESDTKKCALETSRICFGTVDAALPELPKAATVLVHAKPPVNMTAKLPSNGLGGQEWVCPSDAKPIPPALNGMSRFTKASRHLSYSGSRQAHFQQSPAFRPGPHEWPGSPQFGYFGAYHQPKATDWLQLDVGRVWRQPVESTLLTYRSAPVLRQKSGQVDVLSQRSIASRTSKIMNIDMPTLVHPGYTIAPGVGYPLVSKEESRQNGRLKSPSPFSSAYKDIEINGPGPNIDNTDNEERIAYDTDVDDYGVYSTGEFDDSDGYIISEEEGERYLDDALETSSADYNQIFGGGVMYWNAADYAGLGYSRAGSQSSEDSSWARQEADLSAVMDDIVNYQPVQGSYSGKGSTSSNVPSCSPSPPSSSSLPLNFEQHLSPGASSNSRHFMPRPPMKDFSGKFVQMSSQGITAEEQPVGSRVPITLEVMEQIRADSSAQPILRPIVVVRDVSLARQYSAGEALRLQEAKSPHIVPRSRRDIPGHRKRPPSPVLRCVPPAPPPPPPSPVAGLRRRRGLMAARSGSSSPRHWGLVTCYKEDSEGSEGRLQGDNSEGLFSTGSRRGGITSNPPMHPLSGALLRERLVAIPPLSLEQEHPDVSIPMNTSLLHNSNPSLHLGLAKLLSALHVEIDIFSQQVACENKMRKPFINMAVKKVAHSLQVLWPRSRINIFGSIATGLALPTSDVDLVVCLPPVRNLEPIKEAGILEGRNGIKETSLQHAARYLSDQDWVKNDSMKTIENTPVPIIMMVAEFLPHQCEIGDYDIPLSFGPNIRKESDETPKLDHGMAALLLDSVSCDLDNALADDYIKGPWGAKGGRHLVHLDISFETPSHTGLRTAELVRELVGQYPALSPLALVLKQFLTDRSLDHPYTGGLSSYCLVLLITRFLQHQHHHSKLSPHQNLGRLFMDFLHFFGCVFDPRRMGVRIRGGGMYVSRGYHNIDPLYIEDPLHPDNNVGRNCFRILQCVKAFADGYATLERKLHEVSNVCEDLVTRVESLELLKMILPCMTNK